MTSEIQTKGDLWRKILGEILKGFFITAEIYRYPGWNIFLRFNKRGVQNKNVLGGALSKN